MVTLSRAAPRPVTLHDKGDPALSDTLASPCTAAAPQTPSALLPGTALRGALTKLPSNTGNVYQKGYSSENAHKPHQVVNF